MLINKFDKNRAMRTDTLNYLNAERLHQRELERRKVVFEQRCNKLLLVIMVFWILFFMFYTIVKGL